MSSDNELTGNELTISDANLQTIRTWFEDKFGNAQQWLDYAAANAGNESVVQEAALAVKQNMADINQLMTQTAEALGKSLRMMSGMQAANEELARQRDEIAIKHDEAITELNTVKAEVEERVRDAYEEGYCDGEEEGPMIDPEWMDEIVSEEVDERERSLFDEVQHVATQLRDMGEAHDADELEAALGLSAEMRERAKELLSRAQMIVWNRSMLEDDDSIEDEESEVDAA